MSINLRRLDLVTYRGALALAFIDSVTQRPVTNGLRVQAWRFEIANPQPARQTVWAEKSQTSGVFGFRNLPGLERYQVGDVVPVGTLSYMVRIDDQRGRYLPQLRRFDLPLADPAVQEIPLYMAPTHTAPVGFATLRGELLRTTAPPNLTIVGPAQWARVVVVVPAENPGDPPHEYTGLADARGMFAVGVPYPMIPSNVSLTEAAWDITLNIHHQPGTFDGDLELVDSVLPMLESDDQQPFHATLEAQSSAVVFQAVSVVNAEDRVYNVVGPPNNTSFSFSLQFGGNPPVQTPINGSSESLSELLIRSA